MTARGYVTCWFMLVAVPVLAWYLPTLDPVKGLVFGMAVPETVYLANLREPQFGCQNLSLRRPEAIVVGDSHSYAGWDFAQLERKLGQRIGACALGGLYAESVLALLDYVLRSSPDAKLVILGYSPRMFWDLPTKMKQIEHHRQVIRLMTPRGTAFLRHVILRQALPHDGEAAAIARHRDRIEILAETEVAIRLAESQHSIRTLRDWTRRLAESRHTAEPDSLARDICKRIRSANVRLWVLHIPESPHLESRYSHDVWRSYRASIDSLAPCAEMVLADQAVSYGLGNRHYVNRYLRDNLDYGIWTRPGPLVDDSAFDADHLNPVGASRFTREALSKLGIP